MDGMLTPIPDVTHERFEMKSSASSLIALTFLSLLTTATHVYHPQLIRLRFTAHTAFRMA